MSRRQRPATAGSRRTWRVPARSSHAPTLPGTAIPSCSVGSTRTTATTVWLACRAPASKEIGRSADRSTLARLLSRRSQCSVVRTTASALSPEILWPAVELLSYLGYQPRRGIPFLSTPEPSRATPTVTANSLATGDLASCTLRQSRLPAISRPSIYLPSLRRCLDPSVQLLSRPWDPLIYLTRLTLRIN